MRGAGWERRGYCLGLWPALLFKGERAKVSPCQGRRYSSRLVQDRQLPTRGQGKQIEPEVQEEARLVQFDPVLVPGG